MIHRFEGEVPVGTEVNDQITLQRKTQFDTRKRTMNKREIADLLTVIIATSQDTLSYDQAVSLGQVRDHLRSNERALLFDKFVDGNSDLMGRLQWLQKAEYRNIDAIKIIRSEFHIPSLKEAKDIWEEFQYRVRYAV